MHPRTRIESIKAFTPPQSGDFYIHPKLGRVRLIRASGGISFWCLTESGKRISLSPSDMQRVYEN